MKKRFTAIFLTLIAGLIMAGASELRAEIIFLKDGSISEGTITVDGNKAITVKLKESNKIVQIPRNAIMRILYTEIYMGKIYVQLINEKFFTCYQVDEDRNSYTFRNDITKTDEFTVKREDVLFIARANPTGLTGDADTQSIRLKWFPPYNKVKKYKVYAKKTADKDFVLVDELSDKETKLKDLTSNTKYSFRVTAIDTEGDESNPSNVFSISTLNILPTAPELNPITVVPGSNTKITWKNSTDVDGKVVAYRIYKKFEGKTELVAEAKNNEFIIPARLQYDSLYIVAVDDAKGESDSTKINIK